MKKIFIGNDYIKKLMMSWKVTQILKKINVRKKDKDFDVSNYDVRQYSLNWSLSKHRVNSIKNYSAGKLQKIFKR